MRRPGRRAALLAAGVAVALAGLLTTAYAHVHVRVTRVYALPRVAIATPGDAASLARGRHLVEVVAQCTTCHGADLAGAPVADDPWIGRVWGPNLTPGAGGLAERSDADLVRAIRHGLRADGTPLVVMPSQYLHQLSDADVAAIVAYLRQLTPIDRVAPGRRVGPLTALVAATGRAPELIPAEMLEAAAPRPRSPAPAASAEYGRYLVTTGGCRVCHHDDLRGGLHPLALPGEPPPADLTPRGPLAAWSEEDFVRALRTGITPDHRQLDPAWMPWPRTARLSDLELRAIWLYLKSL